MNKVILLAPTPPPTGGMASWTLQMLESKLDDNWNIELVDTKMIGGREMYGDNQKRSLYMEIKRCIGIWRNLSFKLKDHKTTVVHTNIPAFTSSMIREYICGCITHKAGKKFIVHFHCTVPNIVKSKFSCFVLKKLCKKCDAIIALNEETKRFLKTKTKTEVFVVPNFIQENQIKNTHIINDKIQKVVYVGGVIKSKGALEMIDVAKKFPSIEFRFVGRVDADIFEYAEKSKVRNVNFLGLKSREEVDVELDNADVFMFLSHFPGEGFSIALTEAMGHGLPCIVTDWAANGDMVENGAGGYVVPVNSPIKAVAALKKMMPKEIRRTQSKYNIDKVRNNYTETVVKRMYVDVYEAVKK